MRVVWQSAVCRSLNDYRRDEDHPNPRNRETQTFIPKVKKGEVCPYEEAALHVHLPNARKA